MPELQRLRADHASAVLAFELANRAYFAASISDRGDEFFEQFPERLSALLDEQEADIGAYHVLVAENGSILGRFNLIFVGEGTAELGYRVAQHVTGRGVATATVRELCRLAATRYGLRTLRAATTLKNAASQKVLTKAGFVPAGPADPVHIGGEPGTWYQRDLACCHSTVALLLVPCRGRHGPPALPRPGPWLTRRRCCRTGHPGPFRGTFGLRGAFCVAGERSKSNRVCGVSAVRACFTSF
ncbi:MAG TPA: GNAT family N-acetyltransferase [Streptosporangiaceae bacterium]